MSGIIFGRNAEMFSFYIIFFFAGGGGMGESRKYNSLTSFRTTKITSISKFSSHPPTRLYMAKTSIFSRNP